MPPFWQGLGFWVQGWARKGEISMALRMLGSFSTGTPLTEICQGEAQGQPSPPRPHVPSLPLLLPFPVRCARWDPQIPRVDGTPGTQTPAPSCPAGPYPLHGSAEARGDGSRSSQLAEIGGSPHVERLLQVQEGVGHLARRHGEMGGDARPGGRPRYGLHPPGCIPGHIWPEHRSHLQAPGLSGAAPAPSQLATSSRGPPKGHHRPWGAGKRRTSGTRGGCQGAEELQKTSSCEVSPGSKRARERFSCEFNSGR